MDTRARVAEARSRLERLATVERLSEGYGQPCNGCFWFAEQTVRYPRVRAKVCTHLVYTERKLDPATGQHVEQPGHPIEQARAPDGLCGPEGLLFEAPDPPHAVIRALRGWALIVAGVGIVGGLAAQIIPLL